MEEEAENQEPEAMFTVPDNVYVDTEFTFTDTSTDDGTISSWSWDFDGDGVEDSTDQNPTHTYDAVGDYDVTLTVTDDGDLTDEYSVTVTVGYTPPTADFTYEPMENITTAIEVTFTDASTAGDANITGWSWDFDGDGVEDANESSATYTFATAGDHEVTLTVTDANEETGTVTKTITVTAAE